MCKERKIPEILICSPCDAVTEEDAEKEYELRKHYKRVFRRGESKCCTFQYIAFAIDNSNMSDALFRKSLQKSMAKSCDIVIVCGDVITPNMKEQIEEAKQYHKEIYRMIEKEDGACIFCYQDKEEADLSEQFMRRMDSASMRIIPRMLRYRRVQGAAITKEMAVNLPLSEIIFRQISCRK